MPQTLEVHKNQFTISTDPARLDVDAIVDMLARAYWAVGRPRERMERALQHSLVFGVYDGNRQIGMARVVTDYSICAYLCDVFIREEHRARGLGTWLIGFATTQVAAQRAFAEVPAGVRVVLEVGTHSPWLSRWLTEQG